MFAFIKTYDPNNYDYYVSMYKEEKTIAKLKIFVVNFLI